MKEAKRRSTCRSCGRHKREAGLISQAGLCRRCGTERLTTELEQLHLKQGEYYARWRSAIIRGVLGTPAP